MFRDDQVVDAQPNPTAELMLVTTTSPTSSHVFSTRRAGAGWAAQSIDGQALTAASFERLPLNVWTLLYLECHASLAPPSALTWMAAAATTTTATETDGGDAAPPAAFLRGALAEVTLWARPLQVCERGSEAVCVCVCVYERRQEVSTTMCRYFRVCLCVE